MSEWDEESIQSLTKSRNGQENKKRETVLERLGKVQGVSDEVLVPVSV